MSAGGATAEGTGLPDGAWPRLHDACRRLGGLVVHVLFRVRVHRGALIPRTGPLVLVSNHTAFLDGPVLFCVLRRRSVFLVKHENYRGLLGRFLRRLGQLPVRRGTPDRTPLLTAVRLLRSGGVVAVFPEGTRGTGEVVQAQHGAAWLARSGEALVLPVACRGIRRPPGSRRRFRPRVDVLVGEPFAVPMGKGRVVLAAATERVRSELSGLVTELDRLLAGELGAPKKAKGERA
ncbi:1-acyl-sn-glycerol-3-phosphate acyltransferase [Allokutzneria sp. A3M-2-11 16]|uniref:lysophospholipid acyltransferase family protein n=1 Tax=Allokutzneria sp. A3M-2-11 16 TaxID=2962043 RepID=UPI0020B8A4FE|nr:lysophospholipid acyltransferase family protein [Allokutzneria sp. A3M-2-11 16]MCP3804144.1 1-acyl-sn-glycerol-3-phosphate acyltransferase [Allokutzneria sp. A3M-2-11 16]